MELNIEQQQAVDFFKGVCVVTASPGSGKTSVLTQRVVALVKKGVKPENIICLTFTNKAANEMKERIAKEIGELATSVWVSTFHSLCVAVLRKYGHLIGLNKDFSVYDDKAQKELMSKVVRMSGEEMGDNDVWKIIGGVNGFREDVLPFDEYAAAYDDFQKEMMLEYLKLLDEFQAVDFSGMQYKTFELIKKFPDVVEQLSTKFQFVLIDEWQDTNSIQYAIVKRIVDKNKNLFIVGDVNQSLYAFRGAKPENVELVKKDFDNVSIVTLPRNYRSTKEILDVSQNLIRHNDNAKDTTLISVRGPGQAVKLTAYQTPQDESDSIARQIEYTKYNSNCKWSDFAILYRTNQLSKTVEASLMAKNIPYKIVGGFSFFDRAEVKTTIAYMTLLANPNDTVAFAKAISTPSRGVGSTMIGRLEKYAMDKKVPIIDACKNLDQIDGISKKAKQEIHKFVNVVDKCKQANGFESITQLIMDSGYHQYMEKQSEEDETEQKRVANIDELLVDVGTYYKDNPNASLSDYLQSVQLASDKKDNDDDAVQLTSIHKAKGLEWKTVFGISLEKSIIPHIFCNDLFEERRCLFVLCSRAKDLLFLSFCKNRMSFNKWNKKNSFQRREPSQFLSELGLDKEAQKLLEPDNGRYSGTKNYGHSR